MARRRLVALIVIILVVVVAVVVAVVEGTASTDDKGDKNKPKHPKTSLSPSPSVTVLRVPTKTDPLRLQVYGDSVGGNMAWAMDYNKLKHKKIETRVYSKVSTSLARPEYFSWPGYMRRDLSHRAVEAVVFMSGANDGQDMTEDGRNLRFGTSAWMKVYHQRVGAAMETVLDQGVLRLYWVGMPRMGNYAEYERRMGVINSVYRAEAEKLAPQVQYIDAWRILATPSGQYIPSYRQPDGVHLSGTGEFKLAEAIYTAIEKDWGIKK